MARHLPLPCEGGHEGMEVSPSGGAQHQRRDGQQHPEDRPPQPLPPHHKGKDEGPIRLAVPHCSTYSNPPLENTC